MGGWGIVWPWPLCVSNIESVGSWHYGPQPFVYAGCISGASKYVKNISRYDTDMVYVFFIVDCTLSLFLLLHQMPKLLCLYMKNVCIRVYSVYTYAYIDGLVQGGHGSGASAVRLSCTNPQKFINVYVYVYVLVREGCRPTAGALGSRFPCTGPSMWSNIRTEDGYSTHVEPCLLSCLCDPYLWCEKQTPMSSTWLWCLQQSKYMLTRRTHSPVLGQWTYYISICMKCYLDLLHSHWMYTLWTIKNNKKKKKSLLTLGLRLKLMSFWSRETIKNTHNLWWINKEPSICPLDRVQNQLSKNGQWRKITI